MLKNNCCNLSGEEQVPGQAERLGMSVRSPASAFQLWKWAQSNGDPVSEEALMARPDLSLQIPLLLPMSSGIMNRLILLFLGSRDYNYVLHPCFNFISSH